jgi:hypothetical protein
VTLAVSAEGAAGAVTNQSAVRELLPFAGKTDIGLAPMRRDESMKGSRRFTLLSVATVWLSVLAALACCAGEVPASGHAADGLASLGIRVSPPDPEGPPPNRNQHYLAAAEADYQQGEWGRAFWNYKQAHIYHPEDPRDPEVLLMIADCAMKALHGLSAVLQAGLESESIYGAKVLTWLANTYGYHIETSEGDSTWRYDKRALREFLRRYPDHDQADKVAYVLVKEDLMFAKYDPAVFFVRDARALACAREFIARYEAVLRRYPTSGMKGQIQSEVALFRGYMESGGPLPASIANPW